jgi:hypothetical protein
MCLLYNIIIRKQNKYQFTLPSHPLPHFPATSHFSPSIKSRRKALLKKKKKIKKKEEEEGIVRVYALKANSYYMTF